MLRVRASLLPRQVHCCSRHILDLPKSHNDLCTSQSIITRKSGFDTAAWPSQAYDIRGYSHLRYYASIPLCYSGTAQPTGLTFSANGSCLALAGSSRGLDFWIANDSTSIGTSNSTKGAAGLPWIRKRSTGLAGALSTVHLCAAAWPVGGPEALLSGTTAGDICLWQSR